MNTTRYWSGFCLVCDCEWLGMAEQTRCPDCGSPDCDLIEEAAPGDEITRSGRGHREPTEFTSSWD